MSDDNVIKLNPDLTDLNQTGLSKEQQDEILVRRRDEMLEFLDGMRGRVMAFDIQSMVFIGFAQNRSDDITFMSDGSMVDIARTAGCLEFLKHSVIQNRIEEINHYDEE